MKKIIFVLSICLAGFFNAQAETIDAVTAKMVAQSFLGCKDASLAYSDNLTKSSSAAYYAFNNPDGGWVIVAGDDCCVPILGYGIKGEFDASNLPSNFINWMEGITKNINAVRGAKIDAKTEIKEQWHSVARTRTSSEKLITTAEWGQDSPFNTYCPTNCPTGCVATAMAIVARHWQYPTKGKGTIPSYKTNTNNKTIAAINIDGFTYDWANMPLSYTSSATTAQKEAVARLMQHCGAMVEMDYTSSGSGAYSSAIVPALNTYFGYSASARELNRVNYSNNEWFTMIKEEIDASHPILYGGCDSQTEDGHQFVLDGYNSDNMVHINWGWNGTLNGWYAVNYLGDKSSSGVNDVFSYYDSGIFGLVPDESGSSKDEVELMLYAENNCLGLKLSSGTIAKGSDFSLQIGYIGSTNYYTDYSGAIKVGLYDKQGNLKEYVGGESSITVEKIDNSGNFDAVTVSNYECTITKDIALGDYLQAVYKFNDGTWHKLGANHADEFADEEYYTIGKISALDVSYLVVPDSINAGEVLYFDMVGSTALPSSIKWYLDGTANTKWFVQTTSGKHTVKAEIEYSDGGSETIETVITVK